MRSSSTPLDPDGVCRHRFRLRPAPDLGCATATRPDRRRVRLGARGEQLAAFHLEEHDGLQVIARNWRVTLDELRGELDVVARDPQDGTVVVCEVKTRRDAARRDGAVGALGPRQQARIRRMVGVLLATGELRARQVRFDLIALDLGALDLCARPDDDTERTPRRSAARVSDGPGEVVLLVHHRDAW